MKLLLIAALGTLCISCADMTKIENFEPLKKKKTSVLADTQFKIVTKKENGVVRTLKVPKQKFKNISDYEGIIIQLQDKSQKNIDALESKYNIKLLKRLAIGSYIFENLSEKDDQTLVQEIIDNEPNVSSVAPNWPLGVQPY